VAKLDYIDYLVTTDRTGQPQGGLDGSLAISSINSIRPFRNPVNAQNVSND
jgi:hypothetical protein